MRVFRNVYEIVKMKNKFFVYLKLKIHRCNSIVKVSHFISYLQWGKMFIFLFVIWWQWMGLRVIFMNIMIICLNWGLWFWMRQEVECLLVAHCNWYRNPSDKDNKKISHIDELITFWISCRQHFKMHLFIRLEVVATFHIYF